MSGQSDDALRLVESDKHADVKESTQRPEVEVVDLMEESAEQAKVLARDYASGVKTFTVGDGGFGIDDPDSLKLQSPADKPAETPGGTSSLEKAGDKVTSITYPNGHKLDFEYQADGKLSKVIDPVNGDRWERQGDGSWRHLDREGKDIPAQPCDRIDPKDVEDMTVTPEGGITTYRRDGSIIKENPDLSVETILLNRDILERSDGSQREYHSPHIEVNRSDDGKVQIKPLPTGSHADAWEKNTTKSNPDHPPGTKYYRHRDGTDLTVYPDGKYQLIYNVEPDGTKRNVDYDPTTGNITDERERSFKDGTRERTVMTQDPDGKKSKTRYVYDEEQNGWRQIDPPPPGPTTPR